MARPTGDQSCRSGAYVSSFPADLMEMQRVSPMVNSVRNDSADLVAPVVDPILDIGNPN